MTANDPTLCPRCQKNPITNRRSSLCMNCTAAEQADASGTLPLGREAPKSDPPFDKSDGEAREAERKAAEKPAPNWGGPRGAAAAKPAQEPAQSAEQSKNGKPGPAPTVMVSSGRVEAPMRIVIYGPHGVGKTQFMVDAPAPVLLPVEVGSEGFEVDRLDQPFPPRTMADVRERLKWLQTGDHKYKTLGIDTGDMLEQLFYREAVRQHNATDGGRQQATNIEHVGGGYKKGYSAAKAMWIEFFGELERLRNLRKMHVVIACHAKIEKFSNPRGEDYDRYTLKLHPEAGLGPMQELVDAVLFASFKTGVQKSHKRAKAKGIGGKERVLYTENDAAFDAKNRYDLPPQLPLDWATFQATVESNKSPDLLRKAIDAALAIIGGLPTGARTGGTIGEWVERELAARPNSRRLAQIKNKLESRVEQWEEDETAQQEAREAAGDAT